MATKEDEEARLRADAEMNSKFEKIVDGLAKIGDRLDSAHSRLDAMDAAARKDADEKVAKEREQEEKKEKERADKARHDAARKDKFGHRKDGESDEDYKSRHDADETAMCDALEKGGAEKDKARKDAHQARLDAESEEEKGRKERDEKDRKDAKHRNDAALATENADLKQKLADLTGRVDSLTREVPAEERNAIATAQSRADSVAAMFGQRASAPISGESSLAYRRRLLSGFLKHSAKFKDARLDAADGSILSTIEEVVYGEAAEAARRVDSESPGILIPVHEIDAAGRRITKFNGDNMAWMAPFMTGGQVCQINRKPNG